MFENALIESHRQPKQRRKLVSLPLAIAVHAAGLAIVMAAQLWAVEELPAPEIMVSLVPWNEPAPAPPPAPPPRPPAAPAQQKTVAPIPEAQPVTIPEDVPPPQAATLEDQPGGVPGGVPGGRPGGTTSGVPGGVPGPTPTPEPVPQTPIVVGGDVLAPTLVRRVDPVYPELARLARRQGVVRVEAIVDKAGNVVAARVTEDNVGFGCGEAALDAIRQWRYAHATFRGQPVSVYLQIKVEFQLH